MIRIIVLSMCCLLISPMAFAQEKLEGLWKGSITDGGLDSENSYDFEVFIKKEGKKIRGKSYVHLERGKVVEMEIRGMLYGDMSLYLTDVEFIPLEGVEVKPRYTRKYQLLYRPSIWETTLNGYWQALIPTPFFDGRDRGRIFLKKVKKNKA
ncbi:MAG: hypothetical protein HRU40_09195 [Saprospiraceae bacterium]|nr:hypothetical protein [Saprospiraceae bacterium]